MHAVQYIVQHQNSSLAQPAIDEEVDNELLGIKIQHASDADVENLSENGYFDNLEGSQTKNCPSPLLGHSLKRGSFIRKQTSFAKTDIKSETDQAEASHDSFSVGPKHKYGIKQVFFKNKDVNQNDANVMPSQEHDSIHITKHCGGVTGTINAFPNKKFSSVTPKMVGMLTLEQRKVKVGNYLMKKANRNTHSNVRYKCRQNLANQRFRFQGRFVKLEDLPSHGKHLIIDLNGKRLLKPIFRIDKVNKRDLKQLRHELQATQTK